MKKMNFKIIKNYLKNNKKLINNKNQIYLKNLPIFNNF